jgi:hypothetical protein
MLSPLQKFILKECQGTKVTKRILFKKFYSKLAKPPKVENQQNAITKSLERIIDRGLMIGYGRRTPKKWFIEQVKLTPKGRKMAKTLLGQQQKFPFK